MAPSSSGSPCCFWDRSDYPPLRSRNLERRLNSVRYFIDQARTLASLDTNGTVFRYAGQGWVAADLTVQALAGPGWRAVSAPEAVALQRAIT